MKTFLITGNRAEGKTSFIELLVHLISHKKIDASGFISKGRVNEDGLKDFYLKPLKGGEEIILASKFSQLHFKDYGYYYFNEKALETGENIILHSIKKQCPVIVLDEIGPVELQKNGWYKAVQKIIESHKGIFILSTRRRLIQRVAEFFHLKTYIVIDIKKTSPEKTAEEIITAVQNMD